MRFRVKPCSTVGGAFMVVQTSKYHSDRIIARGLTEMEAIALHNRHKNRGAFFSLKLLNESGTVQCFRCEKQFKLPASVTESDPFPVQCSECGYAHTSHDAKSAGWQI